MIIIFVIHIFLAFNANIHFHLCLIMILMLKLSADVSLANQVLHFKVKAKVIDTEDINNIIFDISKADLHVV